MNLPIHVSVAQPFSLAQSIAFLRGFCPVARDYAITDTSITAAAYGSWFTLRAARDNELVIDLPADAREPTRLARLAAAFVGAHEDPRPFYALAAGEVAHPADRRLRLPRPADHRLARRSSIRSDLASSIGGEVAHPADRRLRLPRPADHRLARRSSIRSDLASSIGGDLPMLALIERLHGLHHVRFLTLEEIAVYCVMMQRNPITRAAAMKARFLAAFGDIVATPAGPLHAFPAFPALLSLTATDIGRAIGHATKGAAIVDVVRGVAELGEDFLATAPYAEARDALLAIRGIGPFSAGAILLRGLGRMDELPTAAVVEDAALAVYGRRFDPDATLARYGRTIGWWSYYLKTGAGRARRTRAAQNVSTSSNSFS